MRRRCADLERRVAELRALGRRPRVCLYALTPDPRLPPPGLEPARALAVRAGWQVGAEQVFTDIRRPGTLPTRYGWERVKRQVRAGFADGVIAHGPSTVAPNREEYGAQLRWFADHFAFVALVHSEGTVGGR